MHSGLRVAEFDFHELFHSNLARVVTAVQYDTETVREVFAGVQILLINIVASLTKRFINRAMYSVYRCCSRQHIYRVNGVPAAGEDCNPSVVEHIIRKVVRNAFKYFIR